MKSAKGANYIELVFFNDNNGSKSAASKLKAIANKFESIKGVSVKFTDKDRYLHRTYPYLTLIMTKSTYASLQRQSVF